MFECCNLTRCARCPQGYAHLLRHRGILPLSPPDVKPEKGAGKQAAATALEGMDAPGRRVARLCNSLLHNGDGLPSESAMIVLRLQHTTKQVGPRPLGAGVRRSLGQGFRGQSLAALLLGLVPAHCSAGLPCSWTPKCFLLLP